MEMVKAKYGNDGEKLRQLSCIEEDGEKRVNMAHLAIIGSHTVNGVAFIHSELIKKHLFRPFYELWPEKFQNKTNASPPGGGCCYVTLCWQTLSVRRLEMIG